MNVRRGCTDWSGMILIHDDCSLHLILIGRRSARADNGDASIVYPVQSVVWNGRLAQIAKPCEKLFQSEQLK